MHGQQNGNKKIQENLIRFPAGLRDFPLPQAVHPAWGPTQPFI